MFIFGILRKRFIFETSLSFRRQLTNTLKWCITLIYSWPNKNAYIKGMQNANFFFPLSHNKKQIINHVKNPIWSLFHCL